MKAYGEFHAAGMKLMRERSPAAPKVILYECVETPDDSVLVSQDCGGLADRMAGFTHIFLFAVLHNFLFFMDWPNHASVFHSPFFDMTYNKSLAVYPVRMEDGVSP